MSNQATANYVQNRVKATLAAIQAIIEVVNDLGEVPSGTVYAAMMSHGLSLQSYEYLIGIAVEAGKIEKRGHLLCAVK